jgi:hypothetical protein
MLYNPNTIYLAQLDILSAPYLGGEWNAYLSHTPASRIGQVKLTAAGTGTYTDDPATALAAAGNDIQVVASTPVVSSAAPVITFACKDNTASGTRTFTADDTTEKITLNTAADATWVTGTVCQVSSATTLPAGLTGTTDYWMIKVTATEFKLATNLANALAGTAINITSAGTGTHTVTIAAAQTMAAVATFSPAAWASDTSSYFQRGYATDLVPAVTGKKITEITSLTSVTNGDANQKYDLYILPEAASYFQVGCMVGVRFNTKERQPISIDCQMEASAFTKSGKTKKGELSTRFKFKGFADGIARFLGHKGTLMLEGVKDDIVTGDRVVFTQCKMGSSHDIPDGDGEHVIEASGEFVEVMMFPAPYSAT